MASDDDSTGSELDEVLLLQDDAASVVRRPKEPVAKQLIGSRWIHSITATAASTIMIKFDVSLLL